MLPLAPLSKTNKTVSPVAVNNPITQLLTHTKKKGKENHALH